MDGAGKLSEERGARGLSRKVKPRTQVWLKLITWYWPKSLFYHLIFKPLALPSLRTKCAYVTLGGGPTGAIMTEMPIAALPPKPAGTVRLVCVSDTHDRFQDVGLPPGDVLVHGGDLVFKGGRGRRDYEDFNRHLGTLPHPVRLVVVGNHDTWVDSPACSKADFVSLLSHGTYLEHDMVTLPLDMGSLRVYGSPRSPLGTSENVAFQYLPQDEPKAWSDIPSDLDLLITHATPAGHGPEGLGDPQLARAIAAKRPRVVVCGHDHTAYGASVMGETLVLNPSIMNDVYYFPVKVPLVYDLPIITTTTTTTE